MTYFLVAADADQIQTFLFRSSHLREVVGGSRLLASFCDEEKENFAGKVIISGGGSFRLVFEDSELATHYLEDLAERFRYRTGVTLTVAGPEPFEEGGFKEANKQLQLKLLEAKLKRPGFEAVAHLPIIAFCASCGVELATVYDSLTPELDTSQQEKVYLCDSCCRKAQFRHDEQNSFYRDFRSALRSETARRDTEAQASIFSRRYWEFPSDPADKLGNLDSTRYVAYLLADGNSIGRLFNQQPNPESLTDLSDRLTKAMWASLAAPVPDLIQRLEELEYSFDECPVIPLIVGGDDIFALFPARYALDTARKVCQAFEQEMDGNATLSAAIVICQSHYPYMLAHEYGEQMLKQAKKLGKSLGGISTINFDVIVGNELPTSFRENAIYRSTLKPYFTKSHSQGYHPAGLDLFTLLEARRDLNKLPGKRKSELRVLFNPHRMKELEDEKMRLAWEQKFDTLRQRLPDDIRSALDQVLTTLGKPGAKMAREIWRDLERTYDIETFHAHGLLDLIETWDYSYRLDLPDMVYQAEEE